MALSYAEKLKDPRWQRKRLEILQRKNFTCQRCDDDKATLHVHHGFYKRGLEPWEYPSETLWCLCEECHEEVQALMADVHEALARIDPFWLEFIWADLTKEGYEPQTWKDIHNRPAPEFDQALENMKKEYGSQG